MPEPAAVYPGPYEWVAQGIRRYGFHGINHQYCVERTARLLGKDLQSLKLVTCHLGQWLLAGGHSRGAKHRYNHGIHTAEGLMMGTRSGSVDPGILTYVMRAGKSTGEQLDELLNTKSGLLGISGISGDMQQIVAAMKDGHPRAKLAFGIFVHRLQAGIGAMIATLGRMDALVFIAGIGENSPEVRAAACANFGFLGLNLDAAKNAQSDADQDISAPESAVHVLIVCAHKKIGLLPETVGAWFRQEAGAGQARTNQMNA